jgi:hypothetical protein
LLATSSRESKKVDLFIFGFFDVLRLSAGMGPQKDSSRNEGKGQRTASKCFLKKCACLYKSVILI